MAGAVIYFRRDEHKAHQRCSGRPHRFADRCADRRRRLCRAGARRSRCARGWAKVQGDRRRSGVRPRCAGRRARLGDCGRGAAAVRDHRRLGRGCRRGAADPRHGGHRFQAAGRDAADLPDVRRRDRARRAVRAHDRKPPGGRGARSGAPRRTASSFARMRCEASRPAATGSTRRFPMAALSSARLVVAADGARSAIREACRHPELRLGLRAVRHRHHRRA